MSAMLVRALLACAACNSSSPPCATAGSALCGRAVACADGGVPRFILGTGDVSFSNEMQCESSFGAGCAANEDSGAVDYGACAQAAADASCASSVNGTGIVVPSACLQ